MQFTPKRLTDGFADASGGMDSGKNPTVATEFNPTGLRRNQFSLLINGTVRGGRTRPRPGFKKLPIPNFSKKNGRFQGAEFYQPDNDPGCIIASIDGRILRFNVGSDNSIQNIGITGDDNPSTREKAWMYQAENFLIVQDGQSKPFIYDGSGSRRAGLNEIPVGTVGAYGMGRIWQTLANGTTFIAGDLVYSNGSRAAVLGVTENTFLNEGGAFSIPSDSGQINAMRFLVNLDTSFGQGPLQVFTPSAVYSMNTPVERETWKDLRFPIKTVSMISYGALSQNGTVAVNGDLFYRSNDGIRSFILAKRNFGQWGNTPISREMNRILLKDDRSLLQFSSAVLFDNRMIMTCSPVKTANGTYHRGLVVLDFDLVSGMSDKLPPAWDGLWTGLNILQLVKGTFAGTERCFAFVLNAGEIELWEITQGDRFDFNTEEKRIEMVIESASYPLGNMFDLKRLRSGDLWIEKLSGLVDFNLKYKPDGYPCWLDWLDWKECAAKEDCDVEECEVPQTFKEQYRPKKKFSQPSDDCDPILKKPYRDGYEFQVRLSVTGYCEIKQLRIHAMTREESEFDKC